MSLRINLKAGEKIIIGKTLIRNGDHKSSFVIEGKDVPILRERYILNEEDLKTPVQLLYFYIQLMYVSDVPAEFHQPYFDQLKLIIEAAPSMTGVLMQVTELVRDEHYYKALQLMQDALEYEQRVLNFQVDGYEGAQSDGPEEQEEE